VRFVETPLAGAFVIEPERHEDERGWFARTFDRDELAARGLRSDVLQQSTSFNARRGTLRGMHWQAEPHGECKLVRCTRGAAYDVAVDLRRDSATYCEWFGLELSPDDGVALYIPKGFAHGFVTLADATEIAYAMSDPHVPESARGARFDDPAFGIEWPQEVVVISARDRGHPDFDR
jgi:dTDP-4-dehydrorhamnose 3,5-epimerase